MKPKKEVIKLLDIAFTSALEKSKGSYKSRNNSIKQEIKRIEREMEQKINSIEKLSNINLISKMEEERAILNQKKEDLQEQIDNKFL